MKKKYEVFISSTQEDLVEERHKIVNVLLSLDCVPRYMEAFYASDISTWNFIKDILSNCDYYIIILAGRYGSICEQTGKSFTQMEYEYAKQLNIPINRYLHENPDILPFNKHDYETENRKKFEEFRKKLQEDKIVKYWSNSDELACSVAISMHHNIVNHLPSFSNSENTIDKNDIFDKLDNIQNTLKKISKEKSNDVLTTTADERINFTWQLKNSLDYIHMFNSHQNIAIFQEVANMTLSGGFTAISDFLKIRFRNSLVIPKLHDNSIELYNHIIKENCKYVVVNFIGKSINGCLNGSILLEYNNDFIKEILHTIKKIYSIDAELCGVDLLNSILAEISSIFSGESLTNLYCILSMSIHISDIIVDNKIDKIINYKNILSLCMSNMEHNFNSFLLFYQESLSNILERIDYVAK